MKIHCDVVVTHKASALCFLGKFLSSFTREFGVLRLLGH